MRLGSDQVRKVQALRNLQPSPPGLHLLAWCIGAWPVKLAGTQPDAGLGWILNYLLSFGAQLLLGDTRPADNPFEAEAFSRDCAKAGGSLAKRQRGEEAGEFEQQGS